MHVRSNYWVSGSLLPVPHKFWTEHIRLVFAAEGAPKGIDSMYPTRPAATHLQLLMASASKGIWQDKKRGRWKTRLWIPGRGVRPAQPSPRCPGTLETYNGGGHPPNSISK